MSRITKKTVAVMIAIVLAFALAMTTVMTYVGPLSANAAGVTADTVIDTNVTSYVKYGGSFTVAQPGSGTVLTVVTPGGIELTAESGLGELTGSNYTIAADELGVYKVVYTRTATSGGSQEFSGSYYYNVECYNDVEYMLIVDGYGSTIPTYIQSGTDVSVTLPDATLYYYDEDEDEWFPVSDDDGSTVYCRITRPDGTVAAYDVAGGDWTNGKTVSVTENGTYFFTYYAELAGGKNVLSEEYTMQAQRSFTDDTDPTLSVSGISSSESIGTEVTLPAATVSDNYDARVQTIITVMHDYGNGLEPVKAAVIDPATGYVERDSEGMPLYYLADENDGSYSYDENGERETTTDVSAAVEVTFDNDKFMSFYPTETGTYEVSYQAKDTSGNDTVAHTYRINVSDTTAPVYDEFDTSIIPTNWGLNRVERAATVDDGTTDPVSVATTVAFPIPELIDNNDTDENLRVSFTMNDPQSNTLLSFSNIYATEYGSATRSSLSNYDSGATYAFFRYWEAVNEDGTPVYNVGDDFKITGTGITGDVYVLVKYDTATGEFIGNFDFAKGTKRTGSYSITYTARDAIGNNRSQSFSVELSSTLSDLGDPTVDFDAPDYLAFRYYETETTINDVLITDSQDTRLDAEYYLVYAPAADGDDFETVVGNLAEYGKGEEGETEGYIELDSSSGSNTLTLVNEDGANKLTVTNADGDEVTVDVTANTVYVAAKATDDVGNTSEMVAPVTVLAPDAFDAQNLTVAFGGSNGETLDVDGVVGEEILVGSAVINYGDAQFRDYTGFELYVQRVLNGEGTAVDEDPLGSVSFETYSYADEANPGNNMIHVDNIRFTPSNAGVYMVVLRAFNVMGASSVKMAFVEITSSGSGGGITTSANINLPDTLEVGQTYTLASEYTVDPGDFTGSTDDSTYGIVRSVQGGRMAIMGNEVTVYSTGFYEFTDYTYIRGTVGAGENGMNAVLDYDYTNRSDDTSPSGNYAGVTTSGADYEFAGMRQGLTKEVGSKIVNASDTTEAVFELQGAMPVYTDINEYVVLPNISAYSSNGAATEIELTVTDPDGNDVAVIEAGDTLPADFPEGETLEGNEFAFLADDDGTYTVVYTATLNNRTSTVEYTIKSGDVIPPDVTVNLGSINSTTINTGASSSTSARVGNTFDFAAITVNGESTTGFTFNKELKDPNGSTVATVTSQNLANNGSSYELSVAGQYQVIYTVTDDAGNSTVVRYTIVVSSSDSTSPSSGAVTTLAVVLIIVGVLLIAIVVIYLVRFRRRKPSKRG